MRVDRNAESTTPPAGRPVDWPIPMAASSTQTRRIEIKKGMRIMETDFYTLSVLAVMLLSAWLVNHLDAWSSADLAQAVRSQLGRSADAIRHIPKR